MKRELIEFELTSRFETARGVDTSSRSSGFCDFHVHPPCGLHQQRQEDESFSVENDQRHPKIHHSPLPRSGYIGHVVGQHLPTSTQLETIQRRQGTETINQLHGSWYLTHWLV